MAPGLTRAHRLCVGVALGLLLLVGLSAPNAAQPDLAPPGWVIGPRLPLELGPAAVTATLWTAYLLGGVAVFLGLRGRVEALRTWLAPGVIALAALLSAPFGSADHVNYLAYGRILVQGGNPWVDAPITWAGGLDPVTSRVEAPWTTEPSVYGPFGTLLHGLSAWVGGGSLRQGVWVWQLLVVLSWLAVRALLRAALDDDLHGRVDVLWTLNPLVVGIGVLGAHIDTVAAALALAAVVVAALRPGWVGAALAGGLRRPGRVDQVHVCRGGRRRRRRVVGGRPPLGACWPGSSGPWSAPSSWSPGGSSSGPGRTSTTSCCARARPCRSRPRGDRCSSGAATPGATAPPAP